MSSEIQILLVVGAVLGGLVAIGLPLELWWLARRRQLDRGRLRSMAGSASVFIPATLGAGLQVALLLGALGAASYLSPWEIPITPLTAVIAVLGADLMYYWDHRLSHSWRLSWALGHSVHHSGRTFDQAIALRVSILDGVLTPWMYAPLALAGLSPVLVVAAIGVVIGYQSWIHTEAIGRLPWLDGWLNTPANHRVHHAVQERYHDKNFGGILIVWDRLFGTYAREAEPPRYGITHALESDHPWRVHTHEAARLWRDLRAAPSWRDRLQLVLRGPGWSPAAAAATPARAQGAAGAPGTAQA
jgi:sterol desaturase/sphingolipid hydroxylase (fatty acid hydroxylase superfamily)